MNERLESKLGNIPENPGIYQFLNAAGKIIYIGKAKNLQSRVRSYFRKGVHAPHISRMTQKAADVEIIVTDSEIEALLLENNMIKEHQPRYNVLLKDDKSFPYIKITNEEYPRIYPTRRLIRDGSRYLGPYTDVRSMKAALRFISQSFRIRTCKLQIDAGTIESRKHKVCLDYHIKRCDGPCEGLITPEGYQQMVSQAEKLLRGRTADLMKEMRQNMDVASAECRFEDAALIRDRLSQLDSLSEKQKMVFEDDSDTDVFAIAVSEKDSACSVFCIRSGRIVSKKQLHLTGDANQLDGELYAETMKRYYSNEFIEIPEKIVVEFLPDDAELLESWLTKTAKKKIRLTLPGRVVSAQLYKMCKDNASHQLGEIKLQKMKKDGGLPHALTSLKRDLNLKKTPVTIECFDISNLQSSDIVAGMVVFKKGKPAKSDYRKFIIEGIKGPDDFASMEQVITRRYSRLLAEKKQLPELIMVDGGKGQLSSAIAALKELGIAEFQIISLAKRLEEVFVPGSDDPVIIPRVSSALKLLQRIRDEAHRFAVTFHRARRSKRIIGSELNTIKGIGEKTTARLLEKFGSLRSLKEASLEDVALVIGMAKAKIVREYFGNP